MKRKLTSGLYPAVVPLCLWLSLPVMGQDSRIVGRITDASRAVVATVVVTATQVDSGSERQVLSNLQGYYQLAPLPPGKYRIEAVKPGLKPLSRTGVELGPGLTTPVDLQMEDAEVSETVPLGVRRIGAGLLLAYICDLSLGPSCEALEPANPSSLPGVTPVKGVLFDRGLSHILALISAALN